MFERFTPEARKAVVVAQELARAEGSKWIDPDHLAFAALDDPFTTKMLEEAKAKRAPLIDALQRPAIGPPASGHIPFTPTTKQALEHSLRRTLALNHDGITGAHLLIGVVEASPNGLAARALAKQGIGRSQLEYAATSLPVVSGADDYAAVLTALIRSPDLAPERRRELELSLAGQHINELRLATARPLLERLHSEGADSETLSLMITLGELSGDVVLVNDHAETLLGIDDLPNIQGSLGLALAHRGQLEAAGAAITKALSADGFHRYTALLEAAEVALIQGDAADAAQLAQGVDPSQFPEVELLDVWKLAVVALADEAAAQPAVLLGRLEKVAQAQYAFPESRSHQMRIAAVASRRVLRHKLSRRNLKAARHVIAEAAALGFGGVVVEAEIRLAEILATANHRDWESIAGAAQSRAAELGRTLEAQRAAAIAPG